MPKPEVICDPVAWRGVLDKVIANAAEGIPTPTILDAGCGSRCLARYPKHAHVVGIDNCEPAIAQNKQIHEAIIGDIQTHPLPPESYDIVTCIDVLEHLPYPELAIENMWRALKPGGTLLIRAPYLYSVKGIITKYTPHWVHIAFRRYILGNPNAGKPGYPPFRTYLKRSMTPYRVISWIEQNGGDITDFYLRLGNNPYQMREKSIIAHTVFRAVVFAVKLFTLGRFEEYSDYIIAARKREKSR